MKNLTAAVCPKDTPWGHAQTISPIMPGMWFVSTASHGGIYVAPELHDQMPEFMRGTAYSGGGWFEEDIDWCLPIVVFADRLPKDSRYLRVDPDTGHPFYVDAFAYDYHAERKTQWDALLISREVAK